MSEAAEPSAGAGEARKCSGRVVMTIAGGPIVVETFDDGSVTVNGDLVTPASQIRLEPQSIDDTR